MSIIRIIAVIVIIFLAACGKVDYQKVNYRQVNSINSFTLHNGYRIICIDGIEYVKVYRAMSGHFKPDGSLHTCGNEAKGLNDEHN